jgi:hypothetical protein
VGLADRGPPGVLAGLDRVSPAGRADPEAQGNQEDREAPEGTSPAGPEAMNPAGLGGLAGMNPADLGGRNQADRRRADPRLRAKGLEDRAVRDLGQNRAHLGRNRVHPGRAAPNPAHLRRNLQDPDRMRTHLHPMRAHPHRIRAPLPSPTHPGVATHLAEPTHREDPTHLVEATADTEDATSLGSKTP